MQDLLDDISKANRKVGVQAEEYLDRSRKNTKPGNRKPLQGKKFSAILSSVGTEFHSLQLLKPKILDGLAKVRCIMPERSYAKDKVGLRMDFTSQPFPAAQPDFRFKKNLDKHMKQRHRHLYPQ